MKKYFAILGLLFCFSQGNAQIFSGERLLNQPDIDVKRWSWGYFLGFNKYDYSFRYKEYLPSPSTGKDLIVETGIGFNVGLVGSLKLSNNLDIRLEPGVSFNTAGIKATYTTEVDEVSSTHVHIPLLLKFSANRLNNFRPFVVGGVSTSINLSSNENNPEANIRMTTNNYFYEVGVGIDLYFYYFKLSPSLRGVFALNNEFISGTADMMNVETMHTRGIFLNFTFQ
ncbi:PorT family protein [Antarcticibacterium sp. 1MA-6-2]|uniref:type IX secretion/gliding motility protein PorT/SprT n=1 Tax=Antarcticibacterium sp. 1MA-6-2 TaxID=2908210 RepID=UPI001F224688|nr:porin family protein [Antarcticibacterium sp. 1MA-6-2]UJH91051.1 PorT family protein [Antarcticibacterium sp. 1MA-6-2]